MEKEKKDYYIGLDVGTNSVGWAATYTDYNLISKKRKDLWGIRLFDEALTAADRRVQRSSRRRLHRRNQRIKILNSIFENEIAKVDPNFIRRLKESSYFEEDKSIFNKNSVFSDELFSDKDYFTSYRTIYDLRSNLIHNSDKKFDIRLVYLAVLHIMKNRGHFLYEGNIGNEIITSEEIIEKINNIKNLINLDFDLDSNTQKRLLDELTNEKLTNRDKERNIDELLKIKSTSKEGLFIKLLLGNKTNLKKLFEIEDEENEKLEISLESANFDEDLSNIESSLEDDFYEVITEAKEIFDWTLLVNLMGDYQYISDAKVESYKKHKDDLAKLKRVVKKYIPEKYSEIFEVSEKGLNNYVAYSGRYIVNKKKKPLINKCDHTKFIEYINKLFKDIADDKDEELNDIKMELSTSNLLIKQRTKHNTVIPHQLHAKELEKILENAEKFYPFLKEKDESGYSNTEKLIKTFNFKIPYYVGPLNDKHAKESGFAWIKKYEGMEKEKIYPWNFEKIVDLNSSSEIFIRRMTNKDTYLLDEDVLAKNSLLYSKYTVLNEINNIKINGEEINVELKKKIFNDLFLNFETVSIAKLKQFITKETGIKEIELTGIDIKINSTMAPYIKINKIIGSKIQEDKYKEAIEDIILLNTILGDEKKALSNKIEEKYGELFTNVEIKKLVKLSFKGWARLSQKLLTGLYSNVGSLGEINIISALWETNLNLMKLLSSSYNFSDEIEKANSKNAKNQTLEEMIDDFYVSPSVKRSIIQAINITDEIIKVMGYEPKKIFIEMAREHGDKKRTTSRLNMFREKYKNCIKDTNEFINYFKGTNNIAKLETMKESDLRAKKLYLYYSQMGMDMYTGERINIEDLYKDKLYDIDHIYPRSLVKDDSIERNLVLTSAVTNQNEKSNSRIIPESIRTKQLKFWTYLKDKGLITSEKYSRLTRTNPLTDDELANFIERQLVFTRQSTKAIASILKRKYDTDICYTKAENSSEFRQDFDIPKSRLVSDIHHAHDAYIAIVVGNVYDTKFTKSPVNFIKKGGTYNLRKIFCQNIGKGDNIAWSIEDNNSIKTVIKNIEKKTINYTVRQSRNNGGLYDQTVYNKEVMTNKIKKGAFYAPLKGKGTLSDASKYGGFDSLSSYSAFIVKHKKGKKENITYEFILNIDKDKIKTKEDYVNYCKNTLKYDSPEILAYDLPMNTKLIVDGLPIIIRSRTDEQVWISMALQPYYTNEFVSYFKKLERFNDFYLLYNTSLENGVSQELNISTYKTILDKLENTIYVKRPNRNIDTLNESILNFEKLDTGDQVKLLIELIKYTNSKTGLIDLKLIGASSASGTLRISKNLSKFNSIILVNESITGLYSNEVRIK